MDSFFDEFEQAALGAFKRFPEEQRERINDLFVKETADAQAKLEAEALKKWEADKKEEEAKAEADAKKAQADPKAKKAPPPKKGAKEAAGPALNIPKLEVPDIKDYESAMGKKFVIERSLDDIAEKLMKPAPGEDEENQQDADAAEGDAIARPESKEGTGRNSPGSK